MKSLFFFKLNFRIETKPVNDDKYKTNEDILNELDTFNDLNENNISIIENFQSSSKQESNSMNDKS